MTYDVITISNTGNDQDGYEHGGAHYTGRQVDLEYPTLQEAIDALKNIEFLSPNANTETVEYYENKIGAFDSRSITLMDKSNGMFLYELRPIS